MRILSILFFASFSFSHGDPLNEIIVNPDFIIEVTKITNVKQLHILNYIEHEAMKIPVDELAELRDKKFIRQIIFGNISTDNGKKKIVNINKFEGTSKNSKSIALHRILAHKMLLM